MTFFAALPDSIGHDPKFLRSLVREPRAPGDPGDPPWPPWEMIRRAFNNMTWKHNGYFFMKSWVELVSWISTIKKTIMFTCFLFWMGVGRVFHMFISMNSVRYVTQVVGTVLQTPSKDRAMYVYIMCMQHAYYMVHICYLIYLFCMIYDFHICKSCTCFIYVAYIYSYICIYINIKCLK